MAVVINGSGTVTGLAVGGLPDGTVDAGTLATDSVTAAKIPDTVEADLKSGRKNLIINGGFDVWQRGTSTTASAGNRYLADRWCLVSGTGTSSASRQEFTQGQTDIPSNPKYYHRITVATLGNYTHFDNRIEGVTQSNGKTMTLSFWAKASSSTLLGLELTQTFGGTPEINGGENNIFTTGEGFALTTTWQKFTLTHTLPSFSGETLTDNNRFTVRFVPSSDSSFQARWGGQAFIGDVDIAEVQLELGSVATDFEHRSYGEELALCQRYYTKLHHGNNSGYRFHIQSTSSYPTIYQAAFNLPVSMRATPTYAASYTDFHKPGVRFDTINSHSFTVPDVNNCMMNIAVAATDSQLISGEVRQLTITADAEL